MTADYAALEARVTDLENQMRHILPPKIDAVAYGLSVLHEDLRAFHEETGNRLDRHAELLQDVNGRLDGHGARLDGIDQRLGGIDQRLDSHGAMLQEILRRLPDQS